MARGGRSERVKEEDPTGAMALPTSGTANAAYQGLEYRPEPAVNTSDKRWSVAMAGTAKRDYRHLPGDSGQDPVRPTARVGTATLRLGPRCRRSWHYTPIDAVCNSMSAISELAEHGSRVAVVGTMARDVTLASVQACGFLGALSKAEAERSRGRTDSATSARRRLWLRAWLRRAENACSMLRCLSRPPCPWPVR